MHATRTQINRAQARRPVIGRLVIALACFGLIASACSAPDRYNGFDLGEASIPVEEIQRGGPPRDGIPALDRPRFTDATSAELKPADRVLGLALGDHARAYPLAIMNWHEIVNDRIDGRAVLISYCPLCGSGIAFDAELPGGGADFGVSGLLYNSDLLLYDRRTESLWSQILGEAISGPLLGTRLRLIPLELTSWQDWRARHPRTQVLSRRTGHQRDYDRDPYAGYTKTRDLYFAVSGRDDRYHPKESVLGIELDDRAKAYPFVELARAIAGPTGSIEDRIGQHRVRVEFDREAHSARIESADGRPLPGIHSYWFAWSSFHPDTEVYRAPR